MLLPVLRILQQRVDFPPGDLLAESDGAKDAAMTRV